MTMTMMMTTGTMIMKNSISDRIKITKTGKMLRRPMGIDHFRAKKTGKAIRAKRRYKSFNLKIA